MNGGQNNNKPNRIYLYVILVWLILLAILSVMIFKSNIQSAQNTFDVNSMNLYHMISDQIKTNETVVEGFAALVGSLGKIDRRKIRTFSRQMLKRYPHIFMFEVAEKVPARRKLQFEKDYRKQVYQNFSIREFSYNNGRQWTESHQKEFYLPIVFMEPFPRSSQKVLGLDLNSDSFFIESLRQSTELQHPVATKPFTLVEGERAYLIHRSVDLTSSDGMYEKDGISERYAMLVILARSFFNINSNEHASYGITLYHRDFDKNDSNGHLYYQEKNKVSWLERTLFPEVIFNRHINSETQPLVLSVCHQLGWSTLNWPLILTLFVFAIIAFYVVLHYAKMYHLAEVSRIEQTDHLFYLANHDSLTGLPNRNLMLDRLRHAVNQASRNQTKLAVLFMDLDGFKKINDQYGHDYGDKILRRSSERFLASIRSGDTLARRSGDEFVVVLENIEDAGNISRVINQIKDAFVQEFSIDGTIVKMNVSIGSAVFPDDAKTHEELLNIADKRMYEDKH